MALLAAVGGRHVRGVEGVGTTAASSLARLQNDASYRLVSLLLGDLLCGRLQLAFLYALDFVP